MQGGAELGGKQLCRRLEGGAIRSKVHEEEGQGIQDYEDPVGGFDDISVSRRQDDQQDGGHGEACMHAIGSHCRRYSAESEDMQGCKVMLLPVCRPG